MTDSDSGSPPRLSNATAALLNQFLAQAADEDDPFAEDWNLSQVSPPPPPPRRHKSKEFLSLL